MSGLQKRVKVMMAHVMAAMNMHVHLYNGNFQPDMLCKTWIKGTENYSPKYLVSCVSLVGFQLKRKLWSGTLCGACRGKKSKAKLRVVCDTRRQWEGVDADSRTAYVHHVFSVDCYGRSLPRFFSDVVPTTTTRQIFRIMNGRSADTLRDGWTRD